METEDAGTGGFLGGLLGGLFGGPVGAVLGAALGASSSRIFGDTGERERLLSLAVLLTKAVDEKAALSPP